MPSYSSGLGFFPLFFFFAWWPPLLFLVRILIFAKLTSSYMNVLAIRAQQAKLDAGLRISSSLGTPSIQYVHEYYPFALEVGGRLAPRGVNFVYRLAILADVRRFPSMGAAVSRCVRCESYARMKEFVRQSTYIPFHRFLGDLRREFMQILSVVLHGTLGSYLRDALQGGCAVVVACCLHAPRDSTFCAYFLFLFSGDSTAFD
jgi:hypothetical protein